MVRAIALGGGGARGAFQVGVARALQERGISFDFGVGISVGALNINHVMYGDVDGLLEIWQSIDDRDVHRTYDGWGLAWRLAIERKRGLNDNRPTRALIEKRVTNLHPDAYCGWVDLETGRYEHGPADHANAWASATMPVIWEPVAGKLVDGGLRDPTGISTAIDMGAEHVIAVIPRPAGLRNTDWRPEGRVLIADDLARTIEILTDEIAELRVKGAQRINQLVMAGVPSTGSDGRPHRVVGLRVIRPDRWIGDTLSFRRDEIREAIDHGYEVGMRELVA